MRKKLRKKGKKLLSQYRKDISALAKSINIKLNFSRTNNRPFLSKRWEAILTEIGTKKTRQFRTSTSSMNTKQLEEYAQMLYSFEEEFEIDEKNQKRVEETLGVENVELFNMLEKEAGNKYFEYFLPSDAEYNQVMNVLEDVCANLSNNDKIMQTIGVKEIMRELLDLIKEVGENPYDRIKHIDGKTYGNHLTLIEKLREFSYKF